MLKQLILSSIILFGFSGAGLAANLNDTESTQFKKAYQCFIDKYSQDKSLIQSFIEYKPNKKKSTYRELVDKYGKDKYDKSINALTDYYFECQELYFAPHSQS